VCLLKLTERRDTYDKVSDGRPGDHVAATQIEFTHMWTVIGQRDNAMISELVNSRQYCRRQL